MSPQTADPISVIRAYDTAWNAHDVEKVLAFFTDDAIVHLEPPPPPPFAAISRGKEEIRQFVQGLMPGFHVDSTGQQLSGGRLTWRAVVASDAFKQVGLDAAVTDCEASLRDSKLSAFHVTFAPETVAKIQAAMAAAQGQA
ncbi:MAG: nuclear transport factor 2 family protein [Chloroflexota bacterium]|nr:nuclear transport factor 2 family protein [Chloroflexota bacterium]